LHGIVTDRKTYLRVGSQYGHYTEYDPKTDELTYYDSDSNVRKVFKKLMEGSSGVRNCVDVEVGGYLSHVKCKLDLGYFYETDGGLYEEVLYLAYVTGLDLRLGNSYVIDQMVAAFKNRDDLRSEGFYILMRDIEDRFIGSDEKNREDLNLMIGKSLWRIF